MLIEASAMKVRQNFGDLINQVQYRGAVIEVTKSSKPVAALINIELFEKIKLMQKEFDRLNKAIQNSFKETKSSDFEKEINLAVKKSRSKK